MKTTLPLAASHNSNGLSSQLVTRKIPLYFGLITLTMPVMVHAAETGNAPASTAIVSTQNSFNIPRQPLYSALNALAEQAKVQFIFTEEMVQGLSSPGVSGQLSTQEALKKVLEGSGLSYRVNSGNTITLEKKPVDSSSAPDALPAVKVTGKAVDSTDPYNEDYRNPNSSAATKTDTPIMETPFSVKAVTQQVMEDQQVIQVEKAVENISGVIRSGANSLQTDTFNIRGFDTGNGTGNTYRNGVIFPQDLSQNSTKRETANLERVEVLKGPASLLYGRSEPGGVVNYVTKQPLATPYYSLQQQFGSYDLYRTNADATGALNDEKNLLYRVNLAYENGKTYRDFTSTERTFFAPVLKWEISPQTRATFEIEYQNWDMNPSTTLPRVGGKLYPFKASTNFAGPNSIYNAGDRILGGLNWSHDFNDNWVISQSFQVNSIDRKYAGGYTDTADATGNSAWRALFPGVDNAQTYFTNLNLTGKFKTGALKHTSLFGFDYFKLDNKLTEQTFNYSSAFNVFRPNYSGSFVPDTSPWGSFKRNSGIDWYGLYYQDQVELPFNLFALGGVRYDSSHDVDHLSLSVANNDKVSPRGGLLWRPIPELSVYGSYTENFGANNGFDGEGKSLSPQTAQQWEIGTKTELWDGRFSATLAYYDLKKQNIAVTRDWYSFTTIGAAETRGMEFDISGELLPGWKVIGGYSYMPFHKILQDVDGGNAGKSLPLAPTNSGSLWNTYEFKSGDLKGLKFGAGVISASQRQGNPKNNYQLPGYATVNLLTSYSKNIGKAKITTQFNVDNLLDKT